MEAYLQDKEHSWYETPHNVVGLLKDAVTGKDVLDKKNSTIFYYEKGTELPSVSVNQTE